MKSYVLDTSALLTYIELEDGHDLVDKLLMQSIDDEVELFISVISLIEVYYISKQEQDKSVAKERLELLNDLPIHQEEVTLDMANIIGNLKAEHRMSFADCCIAGLAQKKGAILVHKDPEFECVKNEVKQFTLSYKAS